MAFDALDVELPVYGGVVDVTIPIHASASVLDGYSENHPDSVKIAIDVN
jgi:hypothetical protein